MSDLYGLLYISDLAADAPAHAVADIALQSRTNKRLHNITGLLVFNGLSFAQFLEGPQAAIVRLLAGLRIDPRHERMDVLVAEPVRGERRFPAWRLGYLRLDLQEFGVTSLRGQRGAQALSRFASCCRRST